MSTRPYYRNFKEAPNGFLNSIEELTDVDIAYGFVGVDNSLFLDLVQTDSLPVTAKQILLVAAAVGADLDDAFVEPSQLVEGGVSLSFAATMFDFSASYRGTPQEDSPFFGVGLHDGEVRPEPSAGQQELVARLQEVIDADAPSPDDAIDQVEAALRGFFGALQAEEDATPEPGVGDVLVIDNGDGSGMILIVGDDDVGDVVFFDQFEEGPLSRADEDPFGFGDEAFPLLPGLPPDPEDVGEGQCFSSDCCGSIPGVEDSPEALAAQDALSEARGYQPPRPPEAIPEDIDPIGALLFLAALCETLENASDDELAELERRYGEGRVGFGG